MDNKNSNIRKIFEYELKRKLSTRAKRTTSEMQFLLNCFKFYDIKQTGKCSKSDFFKVIDRIGLIGFNRNELETIFYNYDQYKSGFIDYENFTDYLYNDATLIPLPNNSVNFQPDNFEIENLPFQQIQIENNLDNNNNNNNYIQNNIIDEGLNNFFQGEENQNNNNLNNNYQIQQNYILPNQNLNNIRILNNNNKINEYEPGHFKKYFQSLLTLFQHKININNGMTYYTLTSKLKSKEDKIRKTITYQDFHNSILETNINIDINSIFDFYNSLDLCDLNVISTDEILRVIRGNLSEERKMIIIEAFAKIDFNRKGFTEITYLKSIYNSSEHPEVKMGRKTENEIFGEFVYTFDIFINYKEKTSQCSFEDFIEYYSGISASIENNQYFNDMIHGVWNMENVNNSYFNSDNYFKQQINSINENSNEDFQKLKKVTFNYNNENLNNNNNQIDNQNKIKTPFFNQNNQNNINYTPSKNRHLLRNTISSRANLRRNYNLLTGEDYPLNSTLNPSYQQNNNLNQTQKINENEEKEFIELQKNLIQNENFEAQNSITKLRSFLLQIGSRSIFNLEKMLVMYDSEHTGKIDFQSLESIFENYKLLLSSKEILSIFNMLDYNSTGKINYDDLIKIIVGTMSNERINLIKSIFSYLQPNNNGTIHFSDLKQKFNALNHPEVYSGLKNKNQVYNEFVDNFEVYKEYSLTKSATLPPWINLQDFINFYTQISFGISDDNYFTNLVCSVWNYNLQKNYRNNNNRIVNIGNQIVQNYNKNF